MFGLKNASNLEKARTMVEDILSDLGIDPIETLEEEGSDRLVWCVQRGSATVFIELFRERGSEYFLIDCPLLYLPSQNREKFFKRLLELNDRLIEGSLCLRGEVIHLTGIRPVLGLDAVEVEGMLQRLSSWADGLDNQLSEEFGARLWTGVT